MLVWMGQAWFGLHRHKSSHNLELATSADYQESNGGGSTCELDQEARILWRTFLSFRGCASSWHPVQMTKNHSQKSLVKIQRQNGRFVGLDTRRQNIPIYRYSHHFRFLQRTAEHKSIK
jgi:hypothetical protein